MMQGRLFPHSAGGFHESDPGRRYGFSPHGELAGAFQDSKFKLWVGVIAGAIFWALVIFSTLVDAARILIEP
jgi:hypothetical protein